MGMDLIEEPMTYPSATGITCVTPSPESMTVPVSDRSETFEEVQDAARASTACTAIYRPAQLKDSNMISAVFSRFSGGLRGWKVGVREKYRLVALGGNIRAQSAKSSGLLVQHVDT